MRWPKPIVGVVVPLSIVALTLLATVTTVRVQEDDARYWRTNMGPSVLTAEQESENASKPGSDFTECANGCPTMIVVPAGRFMMGSPATEADRLPTEGPQHEVTVAKPFAVARTEVTFTQWDACVAAGACRRVGDSTWGRGDRPVINVGWNDATQYVEWLARMTGKPYRLLSEGRVGVCRAGRHDDAVFVRQRRRRARALCLVLQELRSEVASRRHQGGERIRPPSTCTAMSTNGSPIPGMKIMRMHRRTVPSGATAPCRTVTSPAAAPGFSMPRTCDRRAVSVRRPICRMGMSAFASRGICRARHSDARRRVDGPPPRARTWSALRLRDMVCGLIR